MNTRSLAEALRKTADYLDSVSSFDIESVACFVENKEQIKAQASTWNKDKFINAVRAMGNVTKYYTEGDFSKLQVSAVSFPFCVEISRDEVCKKIVKFECEPLFSESEMEAL